MLRLAGSTKDHTPATGRASARLVLGLSALWTLVVWFGRIGLIDADADAWMRARLTISLLFGAVLVLLWWRIEVVRSRAAIVTMIAYAVWMVAVWGPSLVVTLASGSSLGFQIVHTVLATVSLLSATAVAGAARRAAFYPPTITSTNTAANSTAR